ncbi:MAG: four helix bundle protein [Candidatus Uhrbacteria bacterium]
MANAKFFELWDWQESHNCLLKIYEVTRNFPPEEKYNLISQIRSAALSIPSNIAEGTGRGSKKDLVRFLIIARGSVEEVLSHLYIAKSLKYLNEENYQELFGRYNKLAKAINNHIFSIQKGEN